MSSMKEGKRRRCVQQKKKKLVKTRSMELENVEMEMCLEVRKGRKTLEVNWTLQEGLACSFIALVL